MFKQVMIGGQIELAFDPDAANDDYRVKLTFNDQTKRHYSVRAVSPGHALWRAGAYAVHAGLFETIVAMEIDE